jgi:hypothetical protein
MTSTSPTATSLLRLTFTGLVAIFAGTAHAQTASQIQPKPASPYRITGTVVSSIDQSPVPRCHLNAALIVHDSAANRRFPTPLDPFDCDERGHFSIVLPSAGSWRLTAGARGFITQAYQEHELFSSAIVLTPAKPTMELQFQISPAATITGVVVDEAGEPVRTAQVSLQLVPPPGPGGSQSVSHVRSSSRTDDRGMYELPQVTPGDYRVSVQAQPWYAAAAQHQEPSDSAPLDPSLDLTYPVTWFPGVDDPEQAETITVHAGDTRQADFHLSPIPSVHLHILPQPGTGITRPNGVSTLSTLMVQQIIPGVGRTFVPVSVHTDSQGEMDLGGLAPGLYQIRAAGSVQQGQPSLVNLTTGPAHTLDLNSPSNEAKVAFHFDGLAEPDSRSVQVSLIDTTTGQGTFLPNEGGGNLGNMRRQERRDPDADRTVEIVPGRYEVVLQGKPNLYLTGMTAKGADVAGRYVTVPSGISTLTLHIASGRATVTGIALFQDKPSVGAMVLLVPTTIEDPNGLRILRRDQTNTDGSFDLADVIPGEYILVTIDHGWQINWSDPSTLRRYLTQGVPIDLASGANVRQNLKAQAP